MHPNSAIISNCCDYIGAQICILIEHCFPHLVSCLVHVLCSFPLWFLWKCPLLIKSCLYFLNYFLFALWCVFNIESHPNSNCTEAYCVVLSAVACSVNTVEAQIRFQGFSSPSTMLCTLDVCVISPIVWWTLSNMELACGFLDVIGFTLMP